jgi:hypothetical protein
VKESQARIRSENLKLNALDFHGKDFGAAGIKPGWTEDVWAHEVAADSMDQGIC